MKRLASAGLALLAASACGDRGEADVGSNMTRREAAPMVQGAPVRSETREFHGWTAVCDNGNDCAAYAQVNDFGSGWVIIKMAAGPEARPSVEIGTWSDEATQGVDVAIDGRRLPLDQPAGWRDGDAAQAIARDPVAFIAALAQGSEMTLTPVGPNPQESGGPVSLRGTAAALLWIDERQGRLGTTTALIRRGERPASSVPAPPVLPVTVAARLAPQDGLPNAAALPPALAALPAVGRCREELSWRGDEAGQGQSVARLSDGRLLWTVLCFVGAYNTGNRFFITGADGANPEPVLLPEPRQPGDAEGEPEDRYVYINADYDPASGTIGAFSKGRGLGDCGSASEWVWTGAAFELKGQSVMNDCAGMWNTLWPTTWRSRDL